MIAAMWGFMPSSPPAIPPATSMGPHELKKAGMTTLFAPKRAMAWSFRGLLPTGSRIRVTFGRSSPPGERASHRFRECLWIPTDAPDVRHGFLRERYEGREEPCRPESDADHNQPSGAVGMNGAPHGGSGKSRERVLTWTIATLCQSAPLSIWESPSPLSHSSYPHAHRRGVLFL